MLSTYYTRPRPVEAVQWNGEPELELVDFVNTTGAPVEKVKGEMYPQCCLVPPGWAVVFTKYGWILLARGWWVVRDRFGDLDVYDPVDFETEFQL